MSDVKKLLTVKKQMKQRGRKFIRDGYGKRKRISKGWKRPRGIHLKVREQRAGHRRKVMPGFRTPALVRGMTLEGLMPVIVRSVNDVIVLDKKMHAAIVGKTVGGRKKLALFEALKKQGIQILNHNETAVKNIVDGVKARKAVREERAAKKSTKKASQPAKEKKETTTEEREAQEKKEKDKILTTKEQ